MTSSAILIKSGTQSGSGFPNPVAKSPGEQSSPDAHAIETGEARRRLPLSLLALGGALLAAGYALFIEKMRFGPPLVMFALGGMTLALTAAALGLGYGAYRLTRRPAATTPPGEPTISDGELSDKLDDELRNLD